MRPTRFIHVAGLRLDSPYSGLRKPSAAVDERLRAAPFEAFRNLQALCESEAPDFLLIAGGVFDLADRSIHAQLAFRDGLASIVGSGVPVYLAHGPSDPAAAWLPTINWPEGVHVMGGRPEWHSVVREDETVALIQGVSQQSSALPGPASTDFQAASTDQVFTVGLVGQVAKVEDNAPDPRDSLPGLDYWALGSEHDGSAQSDSSPRILISGPTQALAPGETGPHGCYVVETDEAGKAAPNFVALDSVRWEGVTVDISNLVPDELFPTVRRAVLDALAGADGRDLVCRLTLTGELSTGRADADLLLKDLRESVLFERPWVWVDRIENLTTVAPEPTSLGASPTLTALQARYASLIDDSALEELVAAATTTPPLPGEIDADNRPGDMSRIARDAYNLAIQHLSPDRGGRS